jgi:hypothetical protein
MQPPAWVGGGAWPGPASSAPPASLPFLPHSPPKSKEPRARLGLFPQPGFGCIVLGPLTWGCNVGWVVGLSGGGCPRGPFLGDLNPPLQHVALSSLVLTCTLGTAALLRVVMDALDRSGLFSMQCLDLSQLL